MKQARQYAMASIALLAISTFSLVGQAQNRAQGDSVRIPIGSQANSNIATPNRGMSKSQVRNQFGEPSRKSRTVGNPPISQWYYPEFTVYFEYSHAVHSVKKAR